MKVWCSHASSHWISFLQNAGDTTGLLSLLFILVVLFKLCFTFLQARTATSFSRNIVHPTHTDTSAQAVFSIFQDWFLGDWQPVFPKAGSINPIKNLQNKNKIKKINWQTRHFLFISLEYITKEKKLSIYNFQRTAQNCATSAIPAWGRQSWSHPGRSLPSVAVIWASCGSGCSPGERAPRCRSSGSCGTCPGCASWRTRRTRWTGGTCCKKSRSRCSCATSKDLEAPGEWNGESKQLIYTSTDIWPNSVNPALRLDPLQTYDLTV